MVLAYTCYFSQRFCQFCSTTSNLPVPTLLHYARAQVAVYRMPFATAALCAMLVQTNGACYGFKAAWCCLKEEMCVWRQGLPSGRSCAVQMVVYASIVAAMQLRTAQRPVAKVLLRCALARRAGRGRRQVYIKALSNTNVTYIFKSTKE
ncbi:hypothetical protein NPIL_695521 [Nephila pilipes]|uniref:Uncharacterized protein n=1 Tax=Nephila pilipes TaxID=299642 RepID=A0A8X6NVK3_NEPPI|nr:hypothetical protein NPIL_695521 [Nephila pilipes]